MAQKTMIILEDDIDGGEADETVTFALDGKEYELDLNSANADKFRGVFQDYIAAARKVSGGRGKAKSAKASGSGRTSEELTEIREWAKSNGHEVSERGRIKQEILDAYDKAN